MTRCLLFLMVLSTMMVSRAQTSEPAIPKPVFRTPEVDSKPEIKDGMYTLPLFVSQNIKLPSVRNKKLKVFVSFIVETNGKISDVRFVHLSVKDLIAANVPENQSGEDKQAEQKEFDLLKDEAVRVVQLFDREWIPATKDGKPVRCHYNYPININLE